MNDANKGILLESGTGEVEILEFEVEGKKYAINVVKVKEILRIDELNKLPNPNPSIAGLTLVRGDVVSVIDMKHVLEGKSSGENKMTLLCEFNNLKVAFLVDRVLGIHRITWEMIQKPDSLVENSLIIGNINLNNNILLLLDFEKIVLDINPLSGISEERVKTTKTPYKASREKKRIFLSDDSPLIRRLLKDTLTLAGYTNLKFFNDGKAVLDYLQMISKEGGFKNEVDLLITDIEMPQMDGHTVTRTIKEDEALRELPVIIFSSLITGDLLHKGDSVGADAQVSKPEIAKLVELIDELLGLE